MRVTIDSSESLEDVIKVVGALYGVELAVASNSQAAPAAPQRGGRRQAGGGRRGRATKTAAKSAPARGGARKRSAAKSSAPDLGAVREWAREHGYQVSSRGPVSRSVIDAYQASGGR